MSNTFGPIIEDAATPYALIGGVRRSIGTIYPGVVVQELHRDAMQITMHPVETGAPVADHAFAMPATVELVCGWSDSTAQATGYVQEVYQSLLKLRNSRKPFNISTGKRQYTNMLMPMLTVKTDAESEYALEVVALCQELLLTSVTTTGNGSGSTTANTNGAASVGSTDGVSISEANAKAAGLTTDGNGNVSWSNDTATIGTSQALPAGLSTTAPSPYSAIDTTTSLGSGSAEPWSPSLLGGSGAGVVGHH